MTVSEKLLRCDFLLLLHICRSRYLHRTQCPRTNQATCGGQLYKLTKAVCGTLPQDLEDDYAKSIRLLSEANPEFAPTYQEGLKPSLKKQPARAAQELEDDCNTGQSGMRVQVKLARFWFMGSW